MFLCSLTAAVCLLALVLPSSGQLPTCNVRNSYQIIPKSDCTGYYMCVWGRPVEMPDCPPGSSFSPTAHVCVPKGSIYDDCSVYPKGGDGGVPAEPKTTVAPVDKKPASIEEQCRAGATLIPHPTECQLYYDCSQRYEYVPRHLEQHMRECPYPQQFNTETNNCEHFEQVKCGQRKEHINACEYRGLQCRSAHCIPCSIRMPSCEGLQDGINAHMNKLWSPYYITCYKGHTISQGRCPSESDGGAQLFHPEVKECVTLDHIPKEHGGSMPDCTGKPNGFYLDDYGRCDQYTACEDGKVLNTVKCQHGETFDALLEACLREEDACGPCGSKDNC